MSSIKETKKNGGIPPFLILNVNPKCVDNPVPLTYLRGNFPQDITGNVA